MKKCEKCGQLILNKTNRARLCTNCVRDNIRKSNREAARKRRGDKHCPICNSIVKEFGMRYCSDKCRLRADFNSKVKYHKRIRKENKIKKQSKMLDLLTKQTKELKRIPSINEFCSYLKNENITFKKNNIIDLFFKPEKDLIIKLQDYKDIEKHFVKELKRKDIQIKSILFGSELTDREFLFLYLRYGSLQEPNREQSQVEIGKKYNLTRQRIDQIEKNAIKKLRQKSYETRKMSLLRTRNDS